MSSLLSLPHEILHHVLRQVSARDLASLNACCKELHKFIPGNKMLWRDVYLNEFDDQPNVPGVEDWKPAWEEDIQALVTMENILQGNDVEQKKTRFREIGERVADLIKYASPNASSNVQFLTKLFNYKQNRDLFFCKSQIFQRIHSSYHNAPISFKDRQLSAKLHCLYGIMTEASSGRATRASRTYPYACSKVYDLRNYTERTMWGPFMEDGSGHVDWERVEAIMLVINHNLKIFGERTNYMYGIKWNMAFRDCVANSYVSKTGLRSELAATDLDQKDPYNITGTYMRIVAFLDFTELFAYNFAFGRPAEGEPRQPLDTTEAIRLITTEIRVTKIEPPGPEDGQALPVVYFEGTSRSMHASFDPNANSGVKGTVRLTKEGEVRWTSFSLYQGEERWRSEGIQLGGICSARGIIGNWFDKDYDVHGPAGPTAYWKISDDIAEHPDAEAEEVEDEDYDVDAGEEEGESAEGDDDGEEFTHQALLDMIQHIHHHHQEVNGAGEVVFTGLGGTGFNVVIEEEEEGIVGVRVGEASRGDEAVVVEHAEGRPASAALDE